MVDPQFQPPNGQVLLEQAMTTQWLWDARNSTCPRTPRTYEVGLGNAFSPDGHTVASGSNDQNCAAMGCGRGICLKKNS